VVVLRQDFVTGLSVLAGMRGRSNSCACVCLSVCLRAYLRNYTLFRLRECFRAFFCFQDLVAGLSVLARGSVEEKLEWAFELLCARVCVCLSASLSPKLHVVWAPLFYCFQDLVTGLSVLARGSVEEKLEWAFGLYDINGDGVVARDEMLNIVTAIYDMIGRCAVPAIDESAIVQHVDNIFQVSRAFCVLHAG